MNISREQYLLGLQLDRAREQARRDAYRAANPEETKEQAWALFHECNRSIRESNALYRAQGGC